MPTRRAEAVWEGGRTGTGQYKGESSELRGRYSFGSRFESESGSNPEELLAAAQASCFNMALGMLLEKAGTRPSRIQTEAQCTIERNGDGYKVSKILLNVRATGAKLDQPTLQRTAEQAKETCPIAMALKGNVRIDVMATAHTEVSGAAARPS